MKMTLLDLRKQPGKLLEAVNHNEDIVISARGKDVAKVIPFNNNAKKLEAAEKHAAYGIWKDQDDSVDEYVRSLRARRYNDI